MPGREYHESLWEAVPEGVRPADMRARLAFLLEHVPVGARVLDVGCGEGWFTAALARAGREAVGIDVAEEPLRRARARKEGWGERPRDLGEQGRPPGEPERSPGTGERGRPPGVHALDLRLVRAHGPWPLEDVSFDAVWAGEVLEHVHDTAGWLSEVRRVLRSGGVLVLSTPAYGPLTRLALGLSGRVFESHFDPRSDHVRFYTSGTLVTLLEDFGFERIETRGLGGPPGAHRTLLAVARRARF
jgi:2-polyprenyl-3-methyl-5-hydroxy-6-metoxy-1,4-benzoquinol methylase